ncbi:outer membrane lipoprotein carrier protein LolA [Candidatus Poribacteria bacterium]
MGKLVKSLSTITLALMLIAFCVSVVYSQESDAKAKEIIEKAFNKYVDLMKKDGEGVKSVAAKLSLKGGGQLPMGDDAMPLDLDVALEIYVERPNNFYISIAGNLGNATIIVSGEEKKTATIMLTGTKQFATLDVPEDAFGDQPADEGEPEEEPKIEELWEKSIVTYEGTESTKLGKAHKIVLKPKDPSEEGIVTVHILDGKWDPARLAFSKADEVNLVVEIEKLEVNAKISDKQFVPNTEGYTGVTQDQLMMLVMMQVMGSMGGGAQ